MARLPRVMEKEENLDDEIFDLKPIIPEIYSSHDHPFSSGSNKFRISDHGNRKANTKQQKSIGSIISRNSCHPGQETTSVIPSSSPAAAAVAISVPKLISFENSKDTDMDYNSNVEMANNYSLTSEIINFSSSTTKDDASEGNNQYHDPANGTSPKRVGAATRTPSQALDHLMAERKRRENLSQLFINLSKVVPGLKKLDKASLLEDGINYLQALQERVRVLEEEEMKQISMDTSKDDSSTDKDSSADNINAGLITMSESAAPEILARIWDRHVLIKIFCKKQTDLMSRIPGEMEKIHLNVMDIRIMPFGGAALDITILGQMNNRFEGTMKEIVDHLQTVFIPA